MSAPPNAYFHPVQGNPTAAASAFSVVAASFSTTQSFNIQGNNQGDPQQVDITITLIRDTDRVWWLVVIHAQDLFLDSIFLGHNSLWEDIENPVQCEQRAREAVNEAVETYRAAQDLLNPADQVLLSDEYDDNTPELARLVMLRLSAIRTKMRKEAERLLGTRPAQGSLAADATSGLQLFVPDADGVAATNDVIVIRVAGSLHNWRFMHSGLLDENLQPLRDYSSRLVRRLVFNVCYRGLGGPAAVPRSFVHGLRHFVTQYGHQVEAGSFLHIVPDQAFVLAGTAVRFCLDTRASGPYQRISFSAANYAAHSHSLANAIEAKRVADPGWGILWGLNNVEYAQQFLAGNSI